jgi:hypothetical protein
MNINYKLITLQVFKITILKSFTNKKSYLYIKYEICIIERTVNSISQVN